MTVSPTQAHSPEQSAQRPKGILKNSNSYQGGVTSPNAGPGPSPTTETSFPPLEQEPDGHQRPSLGREMSDKEITLQNTLANAGPRRNSSNRRSSISRRLSSNGDMEVDENAPRLTWDEANIFLTEQERGSTMKIDEPKTPYTKQYDPAEDEEEIAAIDARELVVDELDSKANGERPPRRKEEIPDLDLGEPEEAVGMSRSDSSEKRVIVDDSADANAHDSDNFPLGATGEAQQKHRDFEEKRKRHYEMRDVKGLLGHPEDMDGVEEEESPPPMP